MVCLSLFSSSSVRHFRSSSLRASSYSAMVYTSFGRSRAWDLSTDAAKDVPSRKAKASRVPQVPRNRPEEITRASVPPVAYAPGSPFELHHLQPTHRPRAGREPVRLDPQALEHRDVQVGQRVV